MFLFIAILWYLQVLVPNHGKTVSDVDAVIKAGNQVLKNNVTEQLIKSEPVQSFLNDRQQSRNRVEQFEAEDTTPILD
ncbi:MAG: hypothetical protein EPN82_16720 [Bacteroidetes bacterium]|nr:MAG: hypothetical protein EPN82_16720 [Bacteroidota bacterium]